jgi:hypothetical protein
MAAGATPPDDRASGESTARVRLVALAVLLGIGAVLAVVALLAGGSGEGHGAGLRVERFPTPDGLELIVYVTEADNQPDVVGGRSSVRVECADAGGQVLVRGEHR